MVTCGRAWFRPPAKPDVSRAQPGDMRAVQAERGAHLDPVGDEIGVRGIADHQDGQPLPSQPEVVDAIARRHPGVRQRGVDVVHVKRVKSGAAEKNAKSNNLNNCLKNVIYKGFVDIDATCT